MRRARQGRQRIARLFFRKRWLFRGKRSFGLAICLRSDTLPWNRCRKRRFRLKPSSISRLTAFITLLAAAFVVAATAAQAPQGPQTPAGSPPLPSPRIYPAPTNLKVLPKNLTGQQVGDIMEQWAGSLGIRCDSCHTEDPENAEPDGHPHLNFADDSKPMKAARASCTP